MLATSAPNASCTVATAHGIDLIGPVHIDPSWQARTPGALDLSRFTVDWKRERVTCPQGQHSVGWHPAKDAKGESVVQVLFAKSVCQRCPVRSMCTDARATGRQYDAAFPAGAPRDVAGGAPTPTDRGIQGALSPPRRNRGHVLADHAQSRCCAAHAIAACPRRISSTCSPRSQPISSAWMLGCRACPSPRHVLRDLLLSPLNR